MKAIVIETAFGPRWMVTGVAQRDRGRPARLDVNDPKVVKAFLNLVKLGYNRSQIARELEVQLGKPVPYPALKHWAKSFIENIDNVRGSEPGWNIEFPIGVRPALTNDDWGQVGNRGKIVTLEKHIDVLQDLCKKDYSVEQIREHLVDNNIIIVSVPLLYRFFKHYHWGEVCMHPRPKKKNTHPLNWHKVYAYDALMHLLKTKYMRFPSDKSTERKLHALAWDTVNRITQRSNDKQPIEIDKEVFYAAHEPNFRARAVLIDPDGPVKPSNIRIVKD